MVIKMIKELYVAPYGDDNAVGDKKNPLATFDGARKKVMEVRKEKEVPVTVNFRGGLYDMSSLSVKFTKEDSGTENAPVIYKAYKDEKPVFSGGVNLNMAKARKVTDENVKSRILDPNAREGLYVIDISEFMDQIPGLEHTFTEGSLSFYRDGNPMYIARWPRKKNTKSFDTEENYLYTPHILHEEPKKTAPFHMFVDLAVLDHVKRCWSEDTLKDVWMAGYIWHNWVHVNYHITSFDYDKNTVTVATGTEGPYCCDTELLFKYRRFYFYNILEELTDHNEYYIDREKKLFYFYPKSLDDEITLTINKSAAVDMEKVEYITFDGLQFEYFRGDTLNIRNSKFITMNNCTVCHNGHTGVYFSGCSDINVTNNHIFDTGANALIAYGRNECKELKPSNILIESNDIHNPGRLKRCGSGCVNISGGVNTRIRKNKIHGTQQTAIWADGIDTVIEYNEIYDATRDTDDASAVYWGRMVNVIGTKIRYNYFHDIGHNNTSTWSISAIYIDDNATGGEIYGNIFHKAAEFGDDNTYWQTQHNNNTVYLNSAQFTYVHDNVFLMTTRRESPMEDVDHNALVEWTKSALGAYIKGNPQSHGMQMQWREVLEGIGFFAEDKISVNELWKEHYKGTVWEPMFEILKGENYTAGAIDGWGRTVGIPDIIKEYNDGKITLEQSTKKFRNYAKQVAGKYGVNYTTNKFERNIVININPQFMNEDNTTFLKITPSKDNMFISLDEAREYFVDFENADYTLSEKGKAAVAEVIDNFDCLPKL